MQRSVWLAIGLSLSVLNPVLADGRAQVLANVNRELPFYVPGVDASTLSTSQLNAINGVIHRSQSHGQKIGAIKSILGGRHSLRGLLFN